MIQLNTLRAQPGATHAKKRLGRGPGSGHGQTAGKGNKGQLARSGGHSRPGFEGGQTPLYRRLPKFGFRNPCRNVRAAVNLSDLERIAGSVKEVTLASLQEMGIVKGRMDELAVLGTGTLTKAIVVKAHKVSASALEKIQKVGGKVEILSFPKYVRAKREKKSKKAKK